MPRVKTEVKYTNPIKSIIAIPDHYVCVTRLYKPTSDETLVAGQKVKATLTAKTVTKAANAEAFDGIIFADQKCYGGENNTVTVLIHGFVDKAKLTTGTGACENNQITLL